MALENGLKLNLVAKNGDVYETGSDKKSQDVVSGCIDGFIFTYFVVCSVLLQVVGGFGFINK